jgi:hypothetical protein
MIGFKKKIKSTELSDISVFNFKTCYNGDLSYFNNDSKLWDIVNEKYEESTDSKKGNDVVLELRKQIAMKSNTTDVILQSHIFIIRNAFDSYAYTGDDYWIKEIDSNMQALSEYGIKYNPKNDIIKEYERCVKLVKNKKNEIEEDLKHLKEATKGGITFSTLVAIVGKYSGSGIINQKQTSMEEFVEFYNLMISDNGK